MSSSPSRRVRLVTRAAVYIALLALLAFVCFLPFAGHYLIEEQPLAKADAIVVLGGARVERWLEGVDLYHEGWAPRIVLSPGRIEDAETRLRERGIRFPAEAELARDAMVQMRVPNEAIAVLPGSLDNTAAEAVAVRNLVATTGWRRVIVVTAKYHTRRSAFAFARAFEGTGVELIVRGTRHEDLTPARWWTRRAEFRWVISELQKLVAYRLGLGG